MSYSELANWDPMEEEYRRNSSDKSLSNDIDPLCLYVRQIPVDFTEESITSLIEGYGRKVIKLMLNRKGITSSYTYGFIYFCTYEDALFTMNKLNGTPPFNLQMSFAKKKRGLERDNNENMKNVSRGRGLRIDIGGRSISQKLKITTGGSGRSVTVESPVKMPTPTKTPVFKSPKQTAEKSKAFQTAVSLPKSQCLQKADVSVPLVPNPYCICFCCGNKGQFACGNCRKPYCSESCQSSDWITHKKNCKQIKEAAFALIKAYKFQPDSLDSSYLSESSNSDHEKSQECCDLEKLIVSSGQFEKVSVTNISSPSKFWVHLKKFSAEFSKMEEELSLLQKNFSLQNVSCMDNLLCSTVYDNKIYRGRILKLESPNEVAVFLLDYGKTVTVPKSALSSLPVELRKLAAQAVCCKLVDETMKEDINWNVEDVLSFQMLASDNKIYRAHILRCVNDVYEVSLINEDGITLFSILAEEKKTMSCVPAELSVSANDGVPPSVWSKLKPKTQVTLVPTNVEEEDSIWCYLLTNHADRNELIEIETLLQGYSGKDITIFAEEGDFAAGFSNQYNAFFRCVILKRKRSSFLVQYIDYGNEEEITQLCALSQKLLAKYCYAVKCEKPASLSLEELKKFLGDFGAAVTVVKVGKVVVELSFNFHRQHSMCCYPCYLLPNNEFGKLTDESQHFGTMSGFSSTSKQNIIPEPCVELKICEENNLLLDHIYKVRVVVIKLVSEVYVQLSEDESKINELITNLNNYCNSKITSHVPNIGEIVCCKFSDGVWYRGLVKKKSKDSYRVFFIDFGNEDDVLSNDVQVLHEKFACPKFAVRVSLSEIKNEDLSKPLLSKLLEETWDMKVIKNTDPPEVILSQEDCSLSCMIKNETSNKKNKTALKSQKLTVGAIVDVKITYKDEQFVYLHQVDDVEALEELSTKLNSLPKLPVPKMPVVGDVLCGLFTDGLWYRVSVEEEISHKIYKVFFFDYGNYENVSFKDLRELPSDLFALPVYCIPVIVQNRENFTLSAEELYTVKAVGNNDEAIEVMFLPDEKQNLEAKNNKANINEKSKKNLKFQELPTGVHVNVKISYEDNKFMYLHLTKDVKSVEELCIQLNGLSELLVPKKPIIGNVYCGLCSDGLWYRVSIEEIVSSDTYKVLFLDFGNNENVSGSDLRELPHDLLTFPVYCIPVTVQNRRDLTLSMEEQYTVRVTGMNGKVQVVEFLLHPNKGDSSVCITESQSKCKMNKAALRFQKLSTECNVAVKISYEDKKFTYLHQIDDIKALEELCVQLNSLSNLTIPKDPVVDDVYCGLFTDGLWYRVSIEEIVSPDMYKVFFLDYGNYDNVTGDDLRELPSDLFSLPIYCIPVLIQNREDLTLSMVEIYVATVIDNVDGLQEITLTLDVKEDAKLPHISSLKKKTLKDGLNEVSVFLADKDIHYCQLSSDNDDVLTMFKDLQKCSKEKFPTELSFGDVICAQSSDGCWYRATIVSNINAPSYKVFFFDYGNTEYVTVDCIKFLPDELLEQPTFAVPIKIENMEEIEDSSVFTEPLTVEKINVLDENVHVVKVCFITETVVPEISTVEEENLSIEEDKEVDNTEDSNEILINSVQESKKFIFDSCKSVPFNSGEQDIVIYSVDEDCYAFCAPYIQENIKANIELSKELTEHCSCNGISFTDSSEPELGEMVLAMYPDDDQWYRGTVVNKSEQSYCVYFVDYGNTELLDISSLRKMEKQFMELEMQAHMCTLTGFSVAAENIQNVYTEVKKFAIFAYQKPLRAFVKVHDDDITISVPKITSWLIEKQLVTPSDEK